MAVDSIFNCVAVAGLSGLVGSGDVRQLAQDAFRRINDYSTDELHAFYAEYLAYLDKAQVRWIRCRCLRRLAASGAAMVRCQDVPPAEAVVGSRGFPRSRCAPKHRFVLSHPWLSRAHPDPNGVKLRALVAQLDLLGAADEDAVFIDYMSLPQHDAQDPDLKRLEGEGRWPKPGEHPSVRTEEEEDLFKLALGSMELIYSMGCTPVIVLPMDDSVETGKEYRSRGWCFFEFCLAFSFSNITNADIHEPVKLLMDEIANLKADTVEGFREGFKRTEFTAKGDEATVLELFERTLDKKKRA